MTSANILRVTNPLLTFAPRRRPPRSGGAPVDRDSGRNAGGTRGRAWINGREVGGTAPRFAHLLGGYD
jgi:hypothetical protein